MQRDKLPERMGYHVVRVLVIDDDEAIRELLSMYFKQVGWEVLTASNGVEAVHVFQSCPDLIDVVLTDLAMPVMSGYEAVRLIWEAKPDAKVICMSDYPENLPPNGATLFPKPFKLDALREAICEALSLKLQ
jgi:CheY-like chemotaxis protein